MAEHDPERHEQAPASAPARRYRFWLVLSAAVVAVAFGYWLSPYVAATRFALAAQRADVEAVSARLDLEALRNSFARQIVRVYLARHPRSGDLDPIARQAVGGIAASYVAAVIGEHLTPEVIADLVRQGGSASRAGEFLGRNAPLPRLDGLGQAWRLFHASGFVGPERFVVDTASLGEGGSYRLVFSLRGTGWKLTGIDLPAAALQRLADELTTRMGR